MNNRLICIVALLFLMLVGVTLIGQSQEPTSRPIYVPSNEIGKDDLLRVNILGATAAGGDTPFLVRVDPDGNITLPIGGAIKVAGLTLAVADATVARHLTDIQVLPNSLVNIERLEEGQFASIRSGPIAPGNVVLLSVWDIVQPGVETRRVYHLSGNGEINAPGLGAVKVAGLTEAQSQAAIARLYHDNNLIPNAMVSVLRAPYEGPESVMDK
jgi:protein involved in polysaccharide export with SLBB domain